jgi:protoporphyrinogen oxidase
LSRIAVVVGAGPAGLTAALEMLRHTDVRPVVIEADTQVGGISKTVNYRGNRMDLGGHRFFSKSDWVMDWWQQILPVESGADATGDNAPLRISYQNRHRDLQRATGAPAVDPAARDDVMLVRSRLSRIYYRRRFFDYPLKLNAATLGNLGAFEALRIGTSYAAARVAQRSPETTLEDFLVNRFGERLYRTFFQSYTEKVWGVPCAQISAEWGAQRIKGLSITRALLHAARSLAPRRGDVSQKQVETSLIERFLYPKLGPGQLWEEVAARVVAAGGELRMRCRVVGLERSGARVVAVRVRDAVSGEVSRIACDEFVSTMPLAELVGMLEPEAAELARIARALPYRDFMTAGLLVRRMRGNAQHRDNWIYIQEPDVRIGRLQIFNNWSPAMVADPATTWLGLEYFCNEGDDLWSMADGAFLDFAARELEKIDLIDRTDVLDGTVVRVPKAYPAYFGEYRHVGRIRDWLDGFENVFPVGRNGMHRYNNQDHSMLAAKAAVDAIASKQRDKRALWAINTEEDYHEDAAPAKRYGT